MGEILRSLNVGIWAISNESDIENNVRFWIIFIFVLMVHLYDRNEGKFNFDSAQLLVCKKSSRILLIPVKKITSYNFINDFNSYYDTKASFSASLCLELSLDVQ